MKSKRQSDLSEKKEKKNNNNKEKKNIQQRTFKIVKLCSRKVTTAVHYTITNCCELDA